MPWTQTDTSFKKLSSKRITTSTGKGLPEEKGASTLELYLPDIKTGTIPGTPPNATTDVLYYTGAIGQTLAVDTSVPGNLTWFATSGYGNTTNANDGSALSESQRLGNWISDKYDGFGTVAGAGYEIKVYDKNNNLITKSDNSNWLFDYQTGILIFNNNVNSYGTGISTNGPYRIVGHRYIGPQGIIPASYGGLGYTSYTLGDILVGAGSTFIKLGVGTDSYVLTASSSSSTGLTWSPTAATGITNFNSLTSSIQYFATGSSGSLFNIASSGSTHTFNIPIAGTGSTGLVSTLAQSFAGIKTFTNDLVVSSSTVSTSTLTGALTVTGGVGIGGSLYLTSSLPSSLSGVVVNNGVITSGSWAGSIITGFYGGTGYNSYTKGDILVGSGSTFIKLNVGTDNFVLTADATSPSGVKWSSVAGLSITSVNGLTASAQFFSTGTSGTGFNISSSGSTHTFNIPIAGTGATGLVSTLAQSFAGTKTFTGDVIVSSTTGSTAFNTGSLTVYGGLGVSGQLSFNQAALGYTGATNPSMAFIGSTTAAPITLTVLSDNSLLWEGTSGKLFGINNNLSSGWIFNVGDISGLPIIRANADGTIAMAEFAANVGIGLSNPSYKLHVVGDTNLSSGYVYRINGVQVLSSTSLGTGVTNSSLTAVGTISTGVWAATAVTSFYGGTGFQTYSTGDLLAGAGSTLTKISVGTNNFILVADSTVPGGIKWASASGLAITNINGLTASKQDLAFGYTGTVPAFSSSGATHTLNIPLAATGATGLVSTQAQSFAGIKTFTNAVNITDNTGSGSYTSGALVVTGGVGIGGTLNVQGDLNVQGTFTTINSTTITVADKNIELGVVATPSDLTAQGGGITLRGGTDKSINWYSGVGWSSSESWNLASGNTYKINGGIVLSATSLGVGITNSSLTALGTITTGTWSATAITALYGGTGLVPSFTVGDILYANTANTWGRLTANSNAGYVLTSAGSGATPTYVAQSTLSVGLATTATYAHQSGYAITSGIATTAISLNVVAASTNTNHHILFTPTSGSASGIAVSSDAGLLFNPASNTLTTNTFSAGVSVNTVAASITGSTASTSPSSGALIVTGGVGIGGSLYVASATAISGVTINNGIITGNLTGTATTATTSGFATTSANLNVANAASGTFFPVLSNTASSTSGIGASVNGFFSFNTATGAFGATSVNILAGQSYSVGGNSVLSATSLGTGVTNSSLTAVGTISTGTWSATAITAFYGGTGYNSYTVGDLLVGAGSTLYKLPVGTNNFVLTADNTAPGGVKWTATAATGVTTLNGLNAGLQYFATGISGSGFNISSSGSTHTFNIPIAGTGATGLVSTLAQSFAGVKTFTNDTIISSSTVSTSTATGALTITGGVGIGGSLYTGTSTASSISGVVLNNGVITTGSWSATAITARYGGTGNTSYTLGDLLVGAGSTFIKLPVGINSYVLGADSSKPSGIGWTTVTPLTVSDTPPASPKNADLWFNSLDGGLLVYYNDVDTAQWVEIALGSGIDLSQPVHITNTTPSTSTSTGALIVDGGVGVAGTVFASSFSINGVYDQISSTLVTSATTVNQVALSLDASSFRTAKMFVQVTSGSNYHSQEILMVHDGSQVYMTEYAMVNTGAIGSTFDGDISGGNMRFLVTPTNAVTTYKIACSAMRI